MKTIIPVPHYGQFLDINDEFWQERTCAIISLAMVLHYYDIPFDVNELFQKALKIDNYDPKIGWKHQTICDVAEIYGLKAKRTDNEKVENLLISLEKDQPVIISIHKNFDPENGGHLVVLNGYYLADGKVEGFYVNDPIGNPYNNKDKFIDTETFMKGWKKRAIFIHK